MRQKRSKAADVRIQGEKNLGPIKKKLAGQIQENRIDKIMTVPNQVDWLIKQATGAGNLVCAATMTSFRRKLTFRR
jgi:hypothetical protein